MLMSPITKLFVKTLSRPAASARLTLCELEPRALPATFLWNPPDVVVPRSTAWSVGDNWLTYDFPNTKYVAQTVVPKLTPGAGDVVEFDGSSTRANSDCIVDVAGGVAIKELGIYSDFTKSLILMNPLTVSGGTSSFGSSAASIRGSASDTPATRGTLTIANQSTFRFASGSFEDVTVGVGGDSKLIVDGPSGTRKITGSDIAVGDTGKLVWSRGDVDVVNRPADSIITIANGGTFALGVAGGVWGMNTPTSPAYFRIYNHGTLKASGPGDATLRGNYFTDFVTQIDGSTLKIDGLAEQTGGFFDLLNGSTIEVTNSKNLLHIRSGSIIGEGTVKGNLLLGDVPVYGPPQMAYPSIAPGHPSPPGMPPPQSLVGTLTITAQFQMVTGSMQIDVLANGTYDRVAVQGTYAALAGDLLIRNDTAYKPLTVSLAFLTAPSILGDFATKYYNDVNWYAPGGKGWYGWRVVKGTNTYVFESYLTLYGQ